MRRDEKRGRGEEREETDNTSRDGETRRGATMKRDDQTRRNDATQNAYNAYSHENE